MATEVGGQDGHFPTHILEPKLILDFTPKIGKNPTFLAKSGPFLGSPDSGISINGNDSNFFLNIGRICECRINCVNEIILAHNSVGDICRS